MTGPTDAVVDPPWVSPAKQFFVDYHGSRLWLDWDKAMQYAVALGLVQHHKQKVHGVRPPGSDQVFWHVRRVPVGAPVAAPGPGADEPTPPRLMVVRDTRLCEHRQGHWICTSNVHPEYPNRHYFTHQREVS